jgi:acid phosphatase type 7
MQASVRSRLRRVAAAVSLMIVATASIASLGTEDARGFGATGVLAAQGDPVVVAAGDLACQSLPNGQGIATCQSGAVANLIRQIAPDRFLALGDLQYNNGKLSEFRRVWDVQFGDLRGITSPIPGNHEYGTTDAAGYFRYFGEIAAPPHGYYSFDLGEWHIVALNSAICGDDPGCGPGSPQYNWLAKDLSANADHDCTLAMMHHPRYDWRPYQKWVVDDGTTQFGGSSTAPVVPFWEALHDAGVELVLNGDNHLYQRWAPQDAHGNAVDGGTVQFTVGTGGRLLYQFGRPPRPENLEVTQNDAFGVVKLTLHQKGYSHKWMSAPRQPEFEDSGTVACS